MTDDTVTLFCVLEGQPSCHGFHVEIGLSKPVSCLRNLIKAELANVLQKVDGNELSLWKVDIKYDANTDAIPVLLDSVPQKTRLLPISKHFQSLTTPLPDDTIHIIIERPEKLKMDDIQRALDASNRRAEELNREVEESNRKAEVANQENAALLAEKQEMAAKYQQMAALLANNPWVDNMMLSPDSALENTKISLLITVKPEAEFLFEWVADIRNATIKDLKSAICKRYQGSSDHESSLLHYYPLPEKACIIVDDAALRELLRNLKRMGATMMSVSFGITKCFSMWSLPEVMRVYKFARAEPGNGYKGLFPAFTGIGSLPLDSDCERVILDEMIAGLKGRLRVIRPVERCTNEATKSFIVGAFMQAATDLFAEDLILDLEHPISGRRGIGKLDYSVHAREDMSYTLGVTEVKKDEDFGKGVAQTIVQLEATLTGRKRTLDDVNERPVSNRIAYGVVTDGMEWAFLECTLRDKKTPQYRLSNLAQTLSYSNDWEDKARLVLKQLAWLWSRMRDQYKALQAANLPQPYVPNAKDGDGRLQKRQRCDDSSLLNGASVN